MTISTDELERALRYLAESAKPFADARGLRCWLEESTRSVKSAIMLESGRTTVAEREAEAYAHPTYKDHLRKLRDAVQNEELIKCYRIAADAKVQVWRTQQASLRAANV